MVESIYAPETAQQQKTQMSLSEIFDDLCMRFILNAPAEDFDNVERLFFHIEEAHWFYTDNYYSRAKKEGHRLPDLAFVEFADAIFNHFPILAPVRHAVQGYTKQFLHYKCKIPVFGAVILNQALDKILLIKGQRTRNWSFPKGKINKHESELQCAIREVKEEVGFDISGSVDEKLFVSRNHKQQITKLFIVSGVPESTQFATQTKGEVDSIKWIRLDALASSSHGSPRKSQLLHSFLKDILGWVKNTQQPSNKPQLAPIQANCPSSPPQSSHHKTHYRHHRKQSPPRPQQQQQHRNNNSYGNKHSCAPMAVAARKNKAVHSVPNGIVNVT